MTKTIKELQLLEFAIYQALTIIDHYKIEFLCMFRDELISCNSLTYSESFYQPVIPPDYENQFTNAPFEPINFNNLFQTLPFPKCHSPRNLILESLKNNPDYFFRLVLSTDFHAICDTNQLSKLPNTLYNVTFLNSNHTLPFLLIDESEPITLLSISVVRKDT